MPLRPYSRIIRRTGKGAEKLLGELELAIMQVAWRGDAVTVRDMVAALPRERPLAYTTIMTVMGRLADKGLLVAEKRGKTYHYRAALTQEEFEAQAAGRMVQTLITDFGGEIAISQFVRELSATDPDQLARLAELARLATEAPNEP